MGSNAATTSSSTLAPLFDRQTLLALAYVASMVATALGLAAVALPRKGDQATSPSKPKTRSKKGAAASASTGADAVREALASSKVKYIFTWLVFDAICHLTREYMLRRILRIPSR